jgi:hypothetical protein
VLCLADIVAGAFAPAVAAVSAAIRRHTLSSVRSMTSAQLIAEAGA